MIALTELMKKMVFQKTNSMAQFVYLVERVLKNANFHGGRVPVPRRGEATCRISSIHGIRERFSSGFFTASGECLVLFIYLFYFYFHRDHVDGE